MNTNDVISDERGFGAGTWTAWYLPSYVVGFVQPFAFFPLTHYWIIVSSTTVQIG